MDLSDIKFVDMRHSKWNEETAVPEEGQYDFDEKVYVDYESKEYSRPEVHLWWCRYDPRNNYAELRAEKYRYGTSGYTPVQVDEDPYWPEPLAPDAKGHYVFGDLILVKCRLLDYLQAKLEKKKDSAQNTGQAKIDALTEKMEREGGGTLSASEVEDLLPKE